MVQAKLLPLRDMFPPVQQVKGAKQNNQSKGSWFSGYKMVTRTNAVCCFAASHPPQVVVSQHVNGNCVCSS
jgi:hypothetical protein